MLRIRGLVLLLLLTCAAAPAFGKTYADTMQFVRFSPCMGNASFCRPRLLATGTLDSEAPNRLAALLSAGDYPETVVFDSPGGSLVAGIKLGRLIRANGLNTVVESAYSEERYKEAGAQPELVELAADVSCYSACAYAFMGGVSRTLGEDARIGVHQFYGMESTSSESNAQIAVATLSQYMLSMGIDRDLLDVASFTDSAEVLVIPHTSAQNYNLDNQSPALGEWKLKALSDGTLLLAVNQQRPGSDSHTSIGIMASKVEGFVTVAIIREGLKSPNEISMARLMAGEETRASLCSQNADCVELMPAIAWEHDTKEETLTAYYVVSASSAKRMANIASSIKFDADFPSAYYNESPSVDVGITGLRNGLMALLR